MANVTLPILATLSYNMISPTGEVTPGPSIAASSQIEQPLGLHASKISSNEEIQLDEEFDLVYNTQQGWQNTEYLQRIDIIDPVFGESYGAWSVGSPRIKLVGSDVVLPVEYVYEKEKTLRISILNNCIPPSASVTVTIPVKILEPKAVGYLSQPASIALVYPIQKDNLDATVDSVPYLEEGTFKVFFSTTWPQGRIAVPGDVIGYSVQFNNTRKTAIAVLKEQFIQSIPEGTVFLGWGIDGKENAPEGFTYMTNVEGPLLTNSGELAIQDQMSISYAVRVVERGNS